MTDKLTSYLRTRRNTLIIELGKIEEILGMERSIVPRRKRVPLRDNETVTHGYSTAGRQPCPEEQGTIG